MKALALAVLMGLTMVSIQSASRTQRWEVVRTKEAVTIKNGAGADVLRYQLLPPGGTNAPFESGCFFHPVKTPSGRVMTEVSPPDHKHHRGVFLAWVEMHGEKDADFWGWGQHAPTKERKIVNRRVSDVAETSAGAGFHVLNEWMAEGKSILKEDLKASVHRTGEAHVLDLVYTLKPNKELKLSRWAFSGFCVRVPKEGRLTAEGPAGPVTTPNPKHTEPDSDWPAAAWYDYDLQFPDGVAGAAVIDHPSNPRTLWHNHRDIRMLNPCVVAPAELILKGKKPLVLRYRVVFHDGPISRVLLDSLAADWAKSQRAN